MSKIKLAIVDDNTFLARAIKEKLEDFEDLDIKYMVYNGGELLSKLEKNHNLDLVLMDIEMPVLDGIETVRIVKQKYPHIKLLMLTVFDNDENIFNAIQAGADGYLLKEIEGQKLYNAITETLGGGAAMSPSIAVKTLKLLRYPEKQESLSVQEDDVSLSSREKEVLEQLAEGLSYTVIANNLFLSPSTVRKHIENIYRKLQVHNKLEAVQKARRQSLI
ncbi:MULTISPECIES: response regulator [Flavobacteriaceae]|uniref:DNA-binding response regulator n=1 Tax=Flagellimonas aequoris TaxID=2306997 RepID=A0A418NDN8_9FLAO|nr:MULTISPECIES: response regulator transcription factor [Allomuricauda]MAU16796.1 DNA-binding response regulator [Allomuricauda sp.]MBA4743732.1 response regulator transcription factor [Allomuricauda sp.]MBO6830672.1 response regulator transcription factor [Allomuricauda sp.]RIV74446.1 DNA-binding response regulator [Allomuricauda aequoris]TXK08574.1 response regulator transcription factor [Allomuricauda aequoris]|tara:strand:+ start:12766 stop:13422 length:657 start_codon:yes stop_codon:yes gene_type:complete